VAALNGVGNPRIDDASSGLWSYTTGWDATGKLGAGSSKNDLRGARLYIAQLVVAVVRAVVSQ
jgi:hypothetical protein